LKVGLDIYVGEYIFIGFGDEWLELSTNMAMLDAGR